MSSPTLQLGNKTYFLEDLPQVSQPLTFDERTIDFCQRWLSGQQQFEIHTSGSTGQPKKIEISRQSMVASANGTIQALDLKPKQTSLVCLDTAYIAGMMMLVRSLEISMNIIAVEPCANPFERIEPNGKIDFVALVPYQIKSILNSPQQFFLNQVQTVLIGGAPLDHSTKLELQNCKSLFFETYGMTETISHIALKKINGLNRSDYFTALPGITIRQDERACLCIQASFLKTEIITNDVIEMKSLDEFIWLGRLDNVINSGGVKVFPELTEEKIEALFKELSCPNRFFVAGLPDEKWGQKVTLLIEETLSKADQNRLAEKMKEKLSKFELPRSIEFVEKFNQTETGKINRRETVALFLQTI